MFDLENNVNYSVKCMYIITLKHHFTLFVSIFSLWLRKNEPEATKKQNASLPHREELKRLKRELIQKLGLLNIRYKLLHSVKYFSFNHSEFCLYANLGWCGIVDAQYYH